MLRRGSVISALSVLALCVASGVHAQPTPASPGSAAPVPSGSSVSAPSPATSASGAPAASASAQPPAVPAGSASAVAPAPPVAPATSVPATTVAPAPSTASPPAASAAVETGSVTATPAESASPALDRGARASEEDKRLQPPTTLGPELLGGGGFRLDGGPDGFAQHTAGDFNFGLGLWAALSRENAFGLVYQRIGLGSARTVPTGSSVSAAYDLNVVWAALRLYPLRGEHTRLFAGLQLGVGWQDIQADGVNVTGEVVTAKPFVCSESSGPTFSIGPTAGLDIDVDRHIAFVAELGAGAHAMSGDVVGGCAPGAGSALTLAGRVGLAYRFDADRWFGEQAGNRSTASR